MRDYQGKIALITFHNISEFNIKYLVDNPQESARLYNLLVSFDLENVLVSVLQYLTDLGTSYNIRLNDIGITTEGNIKIFVPPTAIADPQLFNYSEKAIQSIVDWW